MSSLAAARADGFYNPPDWDPSQISRDKYQGSKGANQYEQFGLIRFEMPWHIWCLNCSTHIGRGVRFNAKKDHCGHYFSTKLWRFTMRCHICKNEIAMETDPENADYKVVSGGRRRVMTYTAESAEVIEIKDEAHKERMELDPIYRLENEETDKRKARLAATRIQRLEDIQLRSKHDYDHNSFLRKLNRQKRKKRQGLAATADSKGLAIELLPISQSDVDAATEIKFKNKYYPTAKGTTATTTATTTTAAAAATTVAVDTGVTTSTVTTDSSASVQSAKMKRKIQRMKIKNESIFRRPNNDRKIELLATKMSRGISSSILSGSGGHKSSKHRSKHRSSNAIQSVRFKKSKPLSTANSHSNKKYVSKSNLLFGRSNHSASSSLSKSSASVISNGPTLIKIKKKKKH